MITATHQWERDIRTARSADGMRSSAPATVPTGATGDGLDNSSVVDAFNKER